MKEKGTMPNILERPVQVYMREQYSTSMMLIENKIRSHINKHIKVAHPELHIIPNQFRFDVIQQHRGAFYWQLSKAILMKNSNAIILNLKDEYSRCKIPDFTLGERG